MENRYAGGVGGGFEMNIPAPFILFGVWDYRQGGPMPPHNINFAARKQRNRWQN